MIDRMQIAELIPHAGSMCLLEHVMHWDAVSIRCMATSHRDPQNPLAVGGQLSAACGVEYAAQAMALHGALVGAVDRRPRRGYLASVRALILAVDRLDNLPGDLVIEAERLAGESSHVSYQFIISTAGNVLLRGRTAAVLDAGRA